jgi:hypothetical protein
MPTARPDIASIASGADLYAGWVPPVSRLAAFIGDSLTEHAFGACPWYLLNGMAGGPLQVIHNAGHSGQSISGLISQIDLAYTASGATGLAGLPPLGWVFLRIGTNTARGADGSTGVPIDGGSQTNYQTVITKLLTYAEHVVIFPVPPIGGVLKAINTAVAGYNSYLQSLVAADTTGRLHWIDDTADLTDETGAIVDGYFNPGDELHFYPPGQYQAALTAEAQLRALVASQGYPSQLVTNPADVYPAQDQWTVNPTNVGTGGTLATGVTGQAPNNCTVQVGSGGAATSAIVAADGADPNQVPWLRVTPTTLPASGGVGIIYDGAGRTVTSGDPAWVEQMLEVRLNDVDPAHLQEVRAVFQSGSYDVTKQLRAQFGGYPERITKTLTMRMALQRAAGWASTGTLKATVSVIGSGSHTGDVGSVDIRCYSNRG